MQAFHTIGQARYPEPPLRSILAYGVAGSSLSLKHGFPAGIVIPRLIGYKSAKFVERIELSDYPIVGYWVGFGHFCEEGPARQATIRKVLMVH